ncbi:N-acetylglucosamine-binding protein GbpA [Psychromonas aquimarina]|uniref:N-acetylglucosamine-binding protein GbpA n=1 Tax=Psychromonas aquimarina TaxID=444919 RepID=UPI000422D410|nr:N-acetylglucosamine-binding protein GbpA [Psychromonas aquimarina]
MKFAKKAPITQYNRKAALGLCKLGSVLLLVSSSGLSAHGFVDGPENGAGLQSRVDLCVAGGPNDGCGNIQYEPQSLEAPSGFPNDGPQDGQIASANGVRGFELDIQTADRWFKNPITAGQNLFEWKKTAPHVTAEWRYYITNQDWNVNEALSRDSFDLTPFCTVDGGMVQPPHRTVHNCEVPERTGYQVILAVWQVGDTTNSFYNVIDVQFEDSPTAPLPGITDAGTIHPSKNLDAGDKVMTRVFDAEGELPELQTVLTIANKAQGVAEVWSHDLAEKINREQPNIKAGQAKVSGKTPSFSPVFGTNPVYTRTASGLVRVEIDFDEVPEPVVDGIEVTGLESQYSLNDNNEVTIDFDVTATGELLVSNTVYDSSNKAKGHAQEEVHNSTETFSMQLDDMTPGVHTLVTIGDDKNGNLIQESSQFTVVETAEHDYVFPDGLSSYTEGTRVLQSKDGSVYQCKPWPNTGYCQQWTETTTQYEPGVGSHWQDAWDKVQ